MAARLLHRSRRLAQSAEAAPRKTDSFGQPHRRVLKMEPRREDQLANPDNERPIALSGVRARQAVTGHNVRYVLGFGLAGAIIVLALVYVIYFAMD
jgi:hypothetical protein